MCQFVAIGTCPASIYGAFRPRHLGRHLPNEDVPMQTLGWELLHPCCPRSSRFVAVAGLSLCRQPGREGSRRGRESCAPGAAPCSITGGAGGKQQGRGERTKTQAKSDFILKGSCNFLRLQAFQILKAMQRLPAVSS